jgi:hypothetical protein
MVANAHPSVGAQPVLVHRDPDLPAAWRAISAQPLMEGERLMQATRTCRVALRSGAQPVRIHSGPFQLLAGDPAASPMGQASCAFDADQAQLNVDQKQSQPRIEKSRAFLPLERAQALQPATRTSNAPQTDQGTPLSSPQL